jgi:hypothetical protein
MTTNDTLPPESDKQTSDKPLNAILGRPRLLPGETKQEAARRLAREMFGKVKPSANHEED